MITALVYEQTSATLQQPLFFCGDGCNYSRGQLHNFPGICTECKCAHCPEVVLTKNCSVFIVEIGRARRINVK